jgi:S-disulfanyl-L-cysteine oxidoreductase SoxD
MKRRTGVWALAALGLAACAGAGLGVMSAGPGGAPERFGFGTPASADRIARWDVNAFPDGKGLPSGSGTVSEGAAVFVRSCAACHGQTGEGGAGGAGGTLVGNAPWTDQPGTNAIGGYWPYATTLYDYIRRAMPQTSPGTLTANETYAVIAWILWRNQLVDENARMDARALAAVQMPARDRFVPDDRTGGPVVR